MIFDIEKILEIMPHRYPFLLIDKVEIISEDEVVGTKNVTFNEPFFQGHFPSDPIMPGVLIIESMVQAGGFLLLNKFEDPKNSNVYFTTINKAKFRNPVRPGDVLKHKVKLTAFRSNFCKLEGKSYVEEQMVAEGSFAAAIVERKK
jgi:UDP-3-O-[3-hydroxymyristoyl] N-acetylglucosamine deacetylase / 3-hydroxyacyl-[acyl-carrier-protein] dehydratase